MKLANRLFRALIISISMCVITACGIDRGGIDEPTPTTVIGIVPLGDPPQSTLATIGLIDSQTGDQIVIGGITLDISSTSVQVNGIAASSSDLSTGMFAVALSNSSTSLGSPYFVSVDFNVAGGPILVDQTAQSFELLGQSISLTTLDLASEQAAPLPVSAPGSIGVSGLTTSSGRVVASAIVNYLEQSPSLVTGVAQQVDTANFTFRIGSQLYDFSQAQLISTATGSVAELDRLRIAVGIPNLNNIYPVNSIVATPLLTNSLPERTRVRLGAFITKIENSAPTQVSFQEIITDNNTVYENFTSTTFSIDQKVLVIGKLQADKKVIAETIRLLN